MLKQNSTIRFYDDNAEEYFKSTVNGNMIEAYCKFLRYISSNGHILDFGCGSGRDSKYFLDHGYIVTAIDGSEKMCKLASNYAGISVKFMDFSELSEENKYDGIWACSSLIHISTCELLEVINKMILALKSHGIIYTCFKNGTGDEIINGRYYNYLTKEDFIELLKKFSELEIIEIYDSKSIINPTDTRYWNNFILRKII